MRVLLVAHAFPPHSQGGSETHAHAHARALVREYGDEVLVLVREQQPDEPEYRVRSEERDGLRIEWINNTFRSTRSFEDSYRNPRIAEIATRLIDRFEPDIAHIHHLTCLSTGIVPALASRGVPCFYTLHDYWLMCHRGQLLDLDLRVCSGPDTSGGCSRCVGAAGAVPPSAFIAARALRTAERGLPRAAADGLRRVATRFAASFEKSGSDHLESRKRTAHMREIAAQITMFFAPSRYIRDAFVRFGIPPARIVHAPYGFDHGLFGEKTKSAPIAPKGRPGPLRLGFLGSLMVSKAPHLLLEACRGLLGSEVTVDLFGADVAYHGDDRYGHELAPLVAQGGVRHHGPLPHEQVPAALRSVDVLVVPSVWPENSPLVIHEAFLAGVPVIASRIGGIPELVQDEVNGLLFEPANVEALRAAIGRLLSEAGLLDRLRSGIGPVRTIEADVAFLREMYGKPSVPKASRLSAVVLNYRAPEDTLLAVRSLLASRRPLDDIIVVDNDPQQSARAVVADLDGPVRYVAAERNLGFPGGVNVGIRSALDRGADAVLLVNSDVIVPPDCAGRLEGALRDAPAAGIVGPLVASRATPGLVASLGISYNQRTGRMRHTGFGDRTSARRPRRLPVDAASGCLLLIDRAVFDRIGLFDEDYFFSFEDIDFCVRARAAGFQPIVAADVIVYHEGGRSLGQGARRIYFAARNHLRLASTASRGRPERHFDAGVASRCAFVVMLNLAHAVRSRGDSLPRRLSAVARGTRDFLAGRFGADPLEARESRR